MWGRLVVAAAASSSLPAALCERSSSSPSSSSPAASPASSALLSRNRTRRGGGGGGGGKSRHPGPSPIPCRDGTMVTPYRFDSREEQLERLQEEIFDVVVIGGGCVGGGVALDASKRGMRVALVEADDFGSGTSGRSTKLIHGGIRYLETAFKKLDYGSYKLVKEALEERAYLLRAAPYMNKPLPIMIPLYKWWEVPYMWVGAKVYDLIAGSLRVVPPSHFMSRDEALYQFPALEKTDLKGAIVYFDGQMNDARLALVITLTAAQQGAAVANFVRATELVKGKDGRVQGVKVQDSLTGKEWSIRARSVVNATGAFVDAIRKLDDPEVVPMVRPAAGVHVILPDHFCPEHMGLVVPKTRDGRVLFFLPWEGATIAGTTDSETHLTMTPTPTEQEVAFIIQESNRYLHQHVSHNDAIATWSGIRPLVMDPARASEGTAALSRDHVVEVRPSGLITVTGGKWTTFRKMAQDAVDALLRAVPGINAEGALDEKCSTADGSLVGADRMGIVCAQKFDQISVTLRNEYGFSREVACHLVRNYGTRALQVAEMVRKRPCFASRAGGPRHLVQAYPYLEAEVAFCVEQEYAVTAIDILARRTRLAFIDAAAAQAASPRVIDIMAAELGWSRARRRSEAKAVEEFLKTMSTSTRNQPFTMSRDVGEQEDK
jgi:glycerol-3-phosphate dehydrogenase